jgi:microcystin-dependent protein
MTIAAGQDILASHFNEIVPIGVVLPYAGSSAPTGFLLCDGSSLLRAGTYADLFTVIGTTFGAADGTHFNVPDMRSRMPIGAGSAPTFVSSFASGSVDTGTDVITVTSNNSLMTGTAVVFTTTTTLPSPLALATTYYVIRLSDTTIKLATSLANAVAGTAINLTTQGTGTHTATVTYTARSLGAVGGEENHAITESELAVHDHGVTDPGHTHTCVGQNTGGTSFFRLDAASGSSRATNSATTGITVDNAGSSEAHNNMPPFIVLNFIIKYLAYA